LKWLHLSANGLETKHAYQKMGIEKF